MKAMILAAGLGTRLRPLTLERAKPAMPLLGKPIIARLIEKLLESGVDDFRINLHHRPASIEGIFQSPPWDALPVSFSYEAQILGTAGGLKANESFFDQETFLMVNAKIVLDFPLDEAIAFHRARRALATLILYPQTKPYRYSPIKIDQDLRLRDFKGTSQGGSVRPETYVFTGVHILEPEIFRFIPPGIFYEINDQVYPRAIENGARVYGFPVEGYWNDPSTPDRYLEIQRDLLLRSKANSPVYVSPEATVADSVRIGQFVSVEARCLLEPDSFAENTILWENVRLKRGASIRNCIVGSGVTVVGECADKIITVNEEAPIA